MTLDDGVIRCPGCGAIVNRNRDSCGVCGADISQVRKKPMEEAVQEEEESVATGEKVLARKELRAIRKTANARLLLGAVGVALLIVAILVGNLPPAVYVPFPIIQRDVSIPGITFAFAGIACLSTALRP